MLRNELIDILTELVSNSDMNIIEKKEIIKLIEKERIIKEFEKN